jgi:hypothetical protein
LRSTPASLFLSVLFKTQYVLALIYFPLGRIPGASTRARRTFTDDSRPRSSVIAARESEDISEGTSKTAFTR